MCSISLGQRLAGMALADAFTADSTGSGCRGGACPNSSVGGGFCRSPSDLGSPGTVGRFLAQSRRSRIGLMCVQRQWVAPVTFYSPESFVRRVAPMLPQEIRRASCCPPRSTSIRVRCSPHQCPARSRPTTLRDSIALVVSGSHGRSPFFACEPIGLQGSGSYARLATGRCCPGSLFFADRYRRPERALILCTSCLRDTATAAPA